MAEAASIGISYGAAAGVPTMSKASPYLKDLTFVVIGRNAEWSIARLLDSIIACTPGRVTSEIIYVDSASGDRTIEIAMQYPVRIVQLSTGQPLCASAGRFIGSQYAIGKYIAFVDSDMELLDSWVEQALLVLENQPEIAVVSGVQLDNGSAAEIEKQRSRDWSTCSQLNWSDVTFAGSAAIFRHDVLDIAGTWNPFIVSDEEPELCLRIRQAGYRIVELCCLSAIHFGYAPATLSALLSRRNRRLFVGYGQVIRYHLHSGALRSYLRERGWVLAPALAGLVAVTMLLVSCISGNAFWIVGCVGVVLLAVTVDAIRSKSVYKAIFHALHRALILEGTIKGLLLHPHKSNEYPRNEQVFEPSVAESMSVQHTA